MVDFVEICKMFLLIFVEICKMLDSSGGADLSMPINCCTLAVTNEKVFSKHSVLGDLRHLVRVVVVAHVGALPVQ